MRRLSALADYSIFGIARGRRRALKWHFHQEKTIFPNTQKVDINSGNALLHGYIDLVVGQRDLQVLLAWIAILAVGQWVQFEEH
jgi:hypothetical protein